MSLLRTALIALATLSASAARAETADCPRKDTLGTSRVLEVDAKTWPRVGTKSYPQTLPLADKEVVLTFDDGPNPPTTKKILAALARECVRATFFQIGQSAAMMPDFLRYLRTNGYHVVHIVPGQPDKDVSARR